MLPQFICDSVLHPFKDLKIKVTYYEIDKSFSPNWKDIEKKYNKKTKAIMMVHYFGYPSEIKKFLNFKKKKKIFLIEDYCHGYGGKENKYRLGSLGDFSFSSLKKIFPETISGGILKINNDSLNNISFLNNIKRKKTSSLIFNFKKKIIDFKHNIKNKYSENQKYADYAASSFAKKTKFLLGDINSYNFLIKKNLFLERKKRFNEFNRIKKIFKSKNVNPLFNLKNRSLLPWYFVGKIDKKNRKNIFVWASLKGLKVFSWPKFPNQVEKIKLNKSNWENIICVKLDDR